MKISMHAFNRAVIKARAADPKYFSFNVLIVCSDSEQWESCQQYFSKAVGLCNVNHTQPDITYNFSIEDSSVYNNPVHVRILVHKEGDDLSLLRNKLELEYEMLGIVTNGYSEQFLTENPMLGIRLNSSFMAHRLEIQL